MTADDVTRSQLAADLPGAAARGEIVAYYQPLIAIAGGAVVGAEALARWFHPRLGLISPEVFIPLAESIGNIVEIGEFMLDTACEFAATCCGGGSAVDIAVNVSAIQLRDENYAARVLDTAARHGLDPRHLTIEVTESEVVHNIADVGERFALLRSAGVTVSIDDFGTGESSIEQLLALQASELKIDRSLVKDRAASSRTLLAAVISFAHDKGLRVVAEGIETSDELAEVSALWGRPCARVPHRKAHARRGLPPAPFGSAVDMSVKDRSIVDAPLLLNRYRPLRILARGGSSSVYRGRDEILGRDVAIKLFKAGAVTDVRKQQEELRVLAGLSHHGVVAVIDAGIDDSTPTDPRPFIVMELVQGHTIRQIIGDRQLSAREIGEIGFEIAEVLEYIHWRGVIHSDITPSNIMLVDYGTLHSRPRARLTDFGIAIDTLTRKKETKGLSGTIAYMSPEQAVSKPIGPPSDIYSLGLVLLECFTNEIAFPGSPMESTAARLTRAPEIPSSVDAAFARVIVAMTARDPSSRPTAGELIEALRAALRVPRD